MATEPRNFVVGLDLGKRDDYTALVVVEIVPHSEPPKYNVVWLDRIRHHSYRDVAKWVKNYVSRPPLGPGVLAHASYRVGTHHRRRVWRGRGCG